EVLAVTLPHRPVVPRDPEPLELAQDRLLTAREVAHRIGVVDPKQQPVAEVTVGDRAQRVSEVERPRRARCEADASHRLQYRRASRAGGPRARAWPQQARPAHERRTLVSAAQRAAAAAFPVRARYPARA